MAKYELDDLVTFYFIIDEVPNKNHNYIKGWTDNKKLAEYYIEFHENESIRMKERTGTMYDMQKILEDNIHNEISISHLITRDRNNKKDIGEVATIAIPATYTEVELVSTECNTFLSGRVDYGYLNDSIDFLKGKYRRALSTIFLDSVILKTIHNKPDKYNSQIEMDGLLVLFKLFHNDVT